MVLPSPQYAACLCVGKLDRLSSLQHVSGGSLTNKYCTIWLHVCNGVGTVVAVFVVYTIPFLLYAAKNMNNIDCGVRTVLQIVIVGRMTEISTSLQAWQCFYSVKRSHSHYPHLTSDSCKGFPCRYSSMHPTHCIKSQYSLRIYCWLLTVDTYWTFMSLHTVVLSSFFNLSFNSSSFQEGEHTVRVTFNSARDPWLISFELPALTISGRVFTYNMFFMHIKALYLEHYKPLENLYNLYLFTW